MTLPENAGGERLPSRRRRWMIFVPTALLLLLAAGWTAGWFYAAQRAEQEVEAALRREAEKGRIYDCGDKRVVGFPFRIELDCERLTASLPGDAGPIVASAPSFRAVAQVYDPNRLIGELRGPVQVTFGGGDRAEVSYALAQASMTLSGGRFERASLVVNAPRVVAGQDEVGSAKAVEAHLRRSPDDAGAYDLAARVASADSPMLALVPAGAGPVSLEVQLEAQGVGDLKAQPTAERLRAFAENGGKLHVALARIDRGDVVAEARGDLKLDRDGRLNGALDLKTRGLEDVIAGVIGGGKKDVLSSLLGAGAALLGGKAQIDGKPAASYPVTIDKGRVALGPVRVYKLPPAF